MTIVLADGVARGIEDHARASYPRECCGFLIGRNEESELQVMAMLPVPNTALCPDRYAMRPEAVLAAMTAARRRELEVLAIYHSHPDRDAFPSPVDCEEAVPSSVHVIVAVHQGELGERRAWRIPGRRLDPVPLRMAVPSC